MEQRVERLLFLGWIYLLGINLLSFAQFGWDKRLAELGLRRISEDQLLMTAMLGGWIGAYLGRSHFRHKTRKQPFGMRLLGLSSLSALTICGGVIWIILAT